MACIQQEHLTHANPAKKFSTPHLHTYLVHTHFLTEDDKHNITNTETKIYIYQEKSSETEQEISNKN